MMNSGNPADDDLLQELLLRWEELYERGQDTPANELAKDHPEVIADLTRLINALKTVSWITKPLVESPASRESTTIPSRATGKVLGGRYRLEELVAEGGFAEVYKAYDTELQRIVALKIPKRSHLSSAESFLAEARRVARLKHDGIVPVYDVGSEGDTCFIVSEFLEGGSLANRLTSDKPTAQQALLWITEIADALDYAHQQGIVHRDIKPANILINAQGRAKLADFGIAESTTKTVEAGPSLGTLRYMSPEQLEGKPADHRSDLYSLGVVLHESLTGRLPYFSDEPSVIRRVIAEGKVSLSHTLPNRLAAFIRKATTRSPHLRHASAGTFASDLRRIPAHPGGSSPYLRLALTAIGVLPLLVLLLPVVHWKQDAIKQFVAADEERPIGIPQEAIKFQNHWYLFPLELAEFAVAQDKARLAGGELAVMDSAEENEFVRQRLGGHITWLGLVRDRGEWVVPGGYAATFFNWFPGQPSDFPGEDVVAIWKDGKWHDHFTNEQRRYVIEWSVASGQTDRLPAPGRYRTEYSNGFAMEFVIKGRQVNVEKMGFNGSESAASTSHPAEVTRVGSQLAVTYQWPWGRWHEQWRMENGRIVVKHWGVDSPTSGLPTCTGEAVRMGE